MRILIAEDEAVILRALKTLLEREKFTVDTAADGAEALDYLAVGRYDVAVLDIMMPRVDGIDVLKRMRSGGDKTPVMLLTAKSEIEDRVAGLNAGADDYLPKPFATAEFIARVKALSRRSGTYSSPELIYGNTALSCDTYELKSRSAVQLNNKEFQIMELFMRNPNRIFSTEFIMERVWGADSETGSDVVWTYIGFLRKKLRTIGSEAEIRTVRGAGYSLAGAPQEDKKQC